MKRLALIEDLSGKLSEVPLVFLAPTQVIPRDGQTQRSTT
jgi:hypothetical protein